MDPFTAQCPISIILSLSFACLNVHEITLWFGALMMMLGTKFHEEERIAVKLIFLSDRIFPTNVRALMLLPLDSIVSRSNNNSNSILDTQNNNLKGI